MASLNDCNSQILKLKTEISSLNDRLKLADVHNDEMRGKMLEYQLESESLEVSLLVYNSHCLSVQLE